MALVVESVHCTPQSAIETPFRVPAAVISYFDLVGIKPGKSEKLSKIFITSVIDFW